MSPKRLLNSVLILAGIAVTPAAHAHAILTEGPGLLAGLAHPLLGIDHLLAGVAVGLWAAQQGGSSVWRLPLAFLAITTVGVGLGVLGMGLPMVEAGIASSLLVLGLLLATAARLPMWTSLALVAWFALFQGYAHGAEMPQPASVLYYAVGLMLSTAALPIAGNCVHGILRRGPWPGLMLRLSGAFIFGSGLVLWA